MTFRKSYNFDDLIHLGIIAMHHHCPTNKTENFNPKTQSKIKFSHCNILGRDELIRLLYNDATAFMDREFDYADRSLVLKSPRLYVIT